MMALPGSGPGSDVLEPVRPSGRDAEACWLVRQAGPEQAAQVEVGHGVGVAGSGLAAVRGISGSATCSAWMVHVWVALGVSGSVRTHACVHACMGGVCGDQGRHWTLLAAHGAVGSTWSCRQHMELLAAHAASQEV